jgi:hypothetical protein
VGSFVIEGRPLGRAGSPKERVKAQLLQHSLRASWFVNIGRKEQLMDVTRFLPDLLLERNDIEHGIPDLERIDQPSTGPTQSAAKSVIESVGLRSRRMVRDTVLEGMASLRGLTTPQMPLLRVGEN